MNLIFQSLAVGLGGAIGAMLRFLCTAGWQRSGWLSAFPASTMTVNFVGCFLIGLLTAWIETRAMFSPHAKLFTITGLLGGLTTFSAFGLESMLMLKDGHTAKMLFYICLKVFVGIALVWVGFRLGARAGYTG